MAEVSYHTFRSAGLQCAGGPTRVRTMALKLAGVVVWSWVRAENNDCKTFVGTVPNVVADELYIYHPQSWANPALHVFMDKITVRGAG